MASSPPLYEGHSTTEYILPGSADTTAAGLEATSSKRFYETTTMTVFFDTSIFRFYESCCLEQDTADEPACAGDGRDDDCPTDQ